MKGLLIILTAVTIFATTTHAGVTKVKPDGKGGYSVTYCSMCWEPTWLPSSNDY